MVAIGRSGVWSRSPRAGKHNADNNDDILIHNLSGTLIFYIDMLQITYFQHGKQMDRQH